MIRTWTAILLAVVLGTMAGGLTAWAITDRDYGPWLERDIRILERDLPPLLPVTVIVESVGGAWGSTSKDDIDGDGRADRFIIRIRPGQQRVIAEDTLVHEWAHTLSWDTEEEEGDHCDAWGIAYARVYRALSEQP